jgi:hypothetical protein
MHTLDAQTHAGLYANDIHLKIAYFITLVVKNLNGHQRVSYFNTLIYIPLRQKT